MAHICEKENGDKLSALIPAEIGLKLELYRFKLEMVLEHEDHWGKELENLRTYEPMEGPIPWAMPGGSVHSCVNNLVRMLDRSDYRMFPEEMMQFIGVIRWIFGCPGKEIQTIADENNIEINVAEEFSMAEVKFLILWVERQCPGAGRALL